ncbi:MAG: hypothetical protein QOF48_648, partial [Verrucomicrobiota bacterium]
MVLGGLCGGVGAQAQTTVILSPAGSVWKYFDKGQDLGTGWRQPDFNDSAWLSGPAQLGFGDGDEATIIAGGPSSSRYVTTYFRRAFVAPAGTNYSTLTARLVRDDGGVVYLNGVEIFRSNMPSGDVNYLTFASSVVGGAAESQFFTTTVGSAPLVPGTNILAIEIHQSDSTSSDVSFNLELTGLTTTTVTRPAVVVPPAPAVVSEGGSAVFTVGVTGTGPLSYQWRADGIPLVNGGHFGGVRAPALSVMDAGSAENANYSVVISNSSGSITSAPAALTVVPLGTEIFDDFEPGIDFAQWEALSGTVRATNYGGSVSPPNSLWFGGDGDRFAVTRPLNTSVGGLISFYLRLADGSLGANWENVDLPDEGV